MLLLKGLIPHGYGLVYGREALAGALPLLFLIKHPLGLVGPFGLRTNHFEVRPPETPGFQQVGWLPPFSGYIFGKP